MKEIFEIFKNDIRKIFNKKIAVIILAGLLFVPGIYAWLNIDSNWDPYVNTGKLPIAVVNEDKGEKILNENINIGNLLIQNLATNKQMKWEFLTDKKEAIEKTKKGEYYGTIILPKDFTSKITTIVEDDKIVKPKFDFYVNQKKNPVAPIIVNKAIGAIQTNIDEAFVNAIAFKIIDKAETINTAKEENSDLTVDNVITKLEDTKNNIEALRGTLNAVGAVSSSSSDVVFAIKGMIPVVSTLNDGSIEDINDLKRVLGKFNDVCIVVNKNIGVVIDSTSTITEEIKQKVDVKTELTQEEIEKLKQSLNRLVTVLNSVNNLLDYIHSTSGLSVDNLKNIVNKSIEKANEIIELLNKGTQVTEEIKQKVTDLNNHVLQIKNDYHNVVEPNINNAYSNISTKMDDISNIIANFNNVLGKSDVALGSTIKALNSNSNLNYNIDKILFLLEIDIDKMIEKLSKVENSDLYIKFINLLKKSPNDVADFISKPIETNEIDLFNIENYGSKMTPFYTVLACWVGCTLLVSIVKTDIKNKKDKEKIKPYQHFFGRFMLFAIMAMLQGLIIGLGDIVMGVQIKNIPLFLLAIMITSLVFSLIIYSLTISFGKVGEAAAVVIMVLQVAGSGGTFPIELVPGLFQKLQPVMPFYPAMNALRETIGGFYQTNYLMCIGTLLLHIIIPLLIGLVFRNPIIEFKNKLSKNLEETDIIV